MNMDFFISDAWAQAGEAAAPNPLISMLPLFALLILFYFMLIRPQMKRSKEHKQMVSNLAKGNEVVTSGGVAGKIRDIGENFIVLEIADNVQVRVQKESVSSVIPKGSLDNL